MFTNLLAGVFGWRGLLVGAGIAFLSGAYSGHAVTKWYYQVELLSVANKSLAARNLALEDNLRLIREVLAEDTKTAEADAAAIAKLRSKVNEAVQATPSTPALSPATVERLRNLWD